MKRVYCFDVDNTLRSSTQSKVLPQTIKLIDTLKSNPNYVLILATGRGPSKMDIIDHIKDKFDYAILVNGGIVFKNKHIIFENHLNQHDVDVFVKDTLQRGISIGMVGYDTEVVTFYDEHVSYAFKGFSTHQPKIDPQFHLNHQVYQLWIFHNQSKVLADIVNDYPQFKPFFWTYGGVDLVHPKTSKDEALKAIMKAYPDYQLITIGDGHNDLEMIKMADIGILMGNSRWH